jgi:glycosyltransferase involved in cell wall biosynthesis
LTDAPQDAAQPTRPLKIVIGADTFAPEINGAATFAARLSAGLAARGHEVHMVAPAATTRKHGVFQETHEGQEFTVHRLFSMRWYPHPWLRFAIPFLIEQNSAKILDEVKPDVVHFQSHIIIGRGLANQATKRGIRVIGTNHFMPENMLEFTLIPKRYQAAAIKAAWAAAARTFGRAEAVTTPTRKAADFLEANTRLRGVYAISCGIEASHYTPSFEPRTENLIVFVGRITGEKQLDKLVRAFAKLDKSLNAKLELVGGGDQEGNLKTLATSLGVRHRVHFAGYVEDEYLKNALTRATVFAMPSIAELQSIATMEAMASGLPIVAANAMALPHLVHDGENGFLFEPGDVDELAARLTDVLTMPEGELQRFKRESLKVVEAHDIQRTLDTFESLYRGDIVGDTIMEPAPEPSKSAWRERLSKLRDND